MTLNLLSNSDLIDKALGAVTHLRELLETYERDMIAIYANQYVSYASNPDDIDNYTMNLYHQFKIRAIMLRDELKRRIRNPDTTDWRACDYRYPKDVNGIDAVAEDLERLARSLSV